MMMATRVAACPTKHRCPECDRYVGESEAGARGWVTMYCPNCKRWRRFLRGARAVGVADQSAVSSATDSPD